MAAVYFATLAALVAIAFIVGRSRAVSVARGNYAQMHSLPAYHGLLLASMVLVPMLLIFFIGTPLVGAIATSQALSYLPTEVQADAVSRATAMRDVTNLAASQHMAEASPVVQSAAEAYRNVTTTGTWIVYALGVSAALLAVQIGLGRISMSYRARNRFEKFVTIVLLASAAVAVLTTIGILFSVSFETFRFFFDPNLKGRPTVTEFLFGTEWNPQAALRADQGDIRTAFGFVPLLTGTILITSIALLVAGPLGLFSAIYLSEYATPRLRSLAKPILEILAGIPTVVLGFFAALTVAPFIRGWGQYFGLDVASELGALAAGLVMGMMIIPFISSLSDDVINAVPQSLRDGSYAMGATKSETIRQVVLPAALPGIVSAFMLAISRAVGETMIVVMAAGLAANLTFNPLEAVTTITVQIKTILVGDQEFDSAKTLAAFALGFVLFFVTLMLNVIALKIVRRYREQYD